MKTHLLNTVGQLKQAGINIEETPPLFKWSYPEEPTLEFQLLIVTLDKEEIVH